MCTYTLYLKTKTDICEVYFFSNILTFNFVYIYVLLYKNLKCSGKMRFGQGHKKCVFITFFICSNYFESDFIMCNTILYYLFIYYILYTKHTFHILLQI